MSFLWGPFSRIIDDFEDNDMEEYDIDFLSNDGFFGAQTSVVKRGDYALEIGGTTKSTGGSEYVDITSTSGLNNYMSRGDTVSFWFRMDDMPATISNNSVDAHIDFFALQIDKILNATNSGDLALQIQLISPDSDSLDKLTETTDFQADTWYRVFLVWHTPDPFSGVESATVVLEDTDETKLLAVSITDSELQNFNPDDEYLNFNYRMDVFPSGLQQSVYYDHIKVTSRSEIIEAKWTHENEGDFVELGESEQFTEQATSKFGTVDGWEWRFGDGNSSRAENPTHTYQSVNDFSVSLIVKDDTTSDIGVVSEKNVKIVTVVETIDDFEDGSLNEYTGSIESAVAASNYQITAAAANHESNGLESNATTGGDSGEIKHNQSISNGNRLKADLRPQNTDAVPYFLWAMQDTSNYYSVKLDSANNEIELKRTANFGNGNDAVLQNVSATIDTGEWYNVDINWQTNGIISVTVTKQSDNSQVASFSGSDTTFTSGNIGWKSDNARSYFDWARRSPQ